MDLLARAIARHRAGRADEAEALYRLTLACTPEDPNALFMLAAIERARGSHDSALDRLTRAVAAAPNRPEIREALGDVQRVLGNPAAALAAYDIAVALAPDRPTSWLRKGDLLLALGAAGHAVTWLALACQHCPGDPDLWDMHGVACMAAARYRLAADAFAMGLALAPQRRDLSVKHAAACLELGRLEPAIAGFRAALAAQPCDPGVEVELALACLAAGRLDEGWTAYAARWQARGDLPPASFARRAWDGRLRPDLRLLVCAEQGVGDQIMFSAGLGIVARALGPDGRLVVECAPKLAPLFARAWPQAVVHPAVTAPGGAPGLIRASYDWLAEHEPIDAVTFMADLGRHLLPQVDGSAHLAADMARAAGWRDWLATLGPGPKIGVCWGSSLSSAHRDHRVPPVAAWRLLFDAFPDASFVNLQYHDRDGSSWAPATQLTTVHVPPGLDQFDDLDGVAALMAGLDLVVSAPTAVASLAGALGVTTLRVMRGCDWSLFGRARRTARSSCETVLLPREWYGASAMAPVIAAARARLAR
jgi:tetratricopeptide (TPR) repeat protein